MARLLPGDDPADYIFGYFEDLVDNNGANTLEEIYAAGAPRLPADEYLWNLNDKLSLGNNRFTPDELNELKQQNAIIQAAAYPRYLKEAISEILNRATARSEGRNLSHGKTAGLLDPSARRANLIENNRPAMKRALGMNAFPGMVGKFLTTEPRITKESRGTVDPALRNLRLRAYGQTPAPLRPNGTGIGGRKKTKSNKHSKPKRKTRRLK
jgi:hypothetical protein